MSRTTTRRSLMPIGNSGLSRSIRLHDLPWSLRGWGCFLYLRKRIDWISLWGYEYGYGHGMGLFMILENGRIPGGRAFEGFAGKRWTFSWGMQVRGTIPCRDRT